MAAAYGINLRWLLVRTADYFGRLDFGGLRVLEIGAGNGLMACSLAALGAEQVTAIEPEAHGSRQDSVSTLETQAARLGLRNLHFRRAALQDFSAAPASFDLIYLLAVINHIAEERVRTVDRDPAGQAVFRGVFEQLLAWLKPGGRLVLSDASSRHAYARLVRWGLLRRHPFQPNIDWSIHQPPEVWARLLKTAGFTAVGSRWATQWRYPFLPRWLVDNPAAVQLYSSLFILDAQRPTAAEAGDHAAA